MNVIADKLGEDIVLLDIRDQTIIADFFVVCSGTSERQMKAIAEEVWTKLKEEHGIRLWHMEGDAGDGWMLLDYGDVMVHIFSPETRAYYDLESFWHEATVLLKMQ